MAEKVYQTIDKFYTLKQLQDMHDAWDKTNYATYSSFIISTAGSKALEKIIEKTGSLIYGSLLSAAAAVYNFATFMIDYQATVAIKQIKEAIALLEKTDPTNGAVRFRTIIYDTGVSQKPYRISDVAITYNKNY